MFTTNVVVTYTPAAAMAAGAQVTFEIPAGWTAPVIVDDGTTTADERNLFAVTMLLYTSTGNTYRAKEVQQWLKSCGFQKTRCLQMKKGTGDWDGVIIEGRKS